MFYGQPRYPKPYAYPSPHARCGCFGGGVVGGYPPPPPPDPEPEGDTATATAMQAVMALSPAIQSLVSGFMRNRSRRADQSFAAERLHASVDVCRVMVTHLCKAGATSDIVAAAVEEVLSVASASYAGPDEDDDEDEEAEDPTEAAAKSVGLSVEDYTDLINKAAKA